MGLDLDYSYLDCLAVLGVGGAHPGGLQLTKGCLAKEKIDERSTVLDAGCGTGQTSAFIAQEYGSLVTALDCNTVMLDKAKKRFTSLQLPVVIKEGSTEDLPFNQGIFDIIISESVISFTNKSLTISEFKRVLKPGGVLLAIEMVLEKSLAEKERKQIVDFYGATQLLTEKEWIRLFQKAGFTRINEEKFTSQLTENEVQNATDFSLSEEIDEKIYEILEKHSYFTEKYKDILGFRIFRCCC